MMVDNPEGGTQEFYDRVRERLGMENAAGGSFRTRRGRLWAGAIHDFLTTGTEWRWIAAAIVVEAMIVASAIACARILGGSR